eukprot:TRINITY_DN3484_c0_g6_i1.p1 TRINITY_DN3484_c0_g6~~TRINITY_DN3484_c0_g6_i1.p1  ORF type:complete len:368 (+),score=95.24 TRINITY_DN3484_c0_g6_i1:55-1158(+)
MEMKRSQLVKICKEGGFFRTPELNDVLYFHYKGFFNIDEIEDYHNAKCVWLEGNAIEKIENLGKLVLIRQLYLQENCLRKIEGLGTLTQLVSINLANNFITKIEGLEGLTKLKSLNLKQNKLKTKSDIVALIAVESLETVDLTGNYIEDQDVMEGVFAKMQNLLSLYSHQNPFCKKIKMYRKMTIGKCSKLKYLDDRPVFEAERRTTNAYMKNGVEGERAERDLINKEEKERNERNRQAFKDIIKQAEKEKAQLKANGFDKPPDTQFHVTNYKEREPTAEDKWFTEQREKSKAKTQAQRDAERREICTDAFWKREGSVKTTKEDHIDPAQCVLVSDSEEEQEEQDTPQERETNNGREEPALEIEELD